MRARATIRSGALMIALLAVSPGCGDGGKSSDPNPLFTVDNYGGYAVLQVGTVATAFGAFFSDVYPESEGRFPVGPFGTDSCRLADDTASVATLVIASVGTALRFTSGSATVVADEIPGAAGSYSGVADDVVPVNSDFSVESSGSANFPAAIIGTLHVPRRISFDTAPEIVPGEPLDLAFTPETGATYVSIAAKSADESVQYFCQSKDDGSFRLSSEITAAIDAGGTVTILASTVTKGSLGGRDMILYGNTK